MTFLRFDNLLGSFPDTPIATYPHIAMNFSSFLRTTSIATAALTCVVAADVYPAFAFQFTPIDENNALVSFDGVTQTPFARYLFSGTLEPKVTGTFNVGSNPAVIQAVADRYTFTSFLGSYFAASLPGTAGTITPIVPQSARFTGAQDSTGTDNFELRFSNLTPTGVVVFSSDLVLTLANSANPSECSNATPPFCGTATFDFGIAQTLQNVTSYSISPASAAVPEPSEIAGSAIAIGLLGLSWSLKRKSVKPLL